MALPIAPIQGIPLPATPSKFPGVAAPSSSFQSILQQSIANVEHNRIHAQDTIDQFLTGESQEVHQVALATQQAELSFEMFMQVRNKVVQAYQEVMRMQV